MGGSLAIGLAAAELTVRLWEPHEPVRPPPRQELAAELRALPTLKGGVALQAPNVTGVFKGALFRTNSDGFRGPEYSKVAPPGTFRAVLIGDSFSMGSGVSGEDTYAARLEDLLDQRDPSRRHEVLNLGVGGFNLRASIKRLKKIGLGYKPDLLIYGWTDNDILGPSYRKTFAKAARVLPSRSRWWDLLRSRWYAIRPLEASYPYELDENYFRNPGAWTFFLESLDEFARIARQQGVCGVVLLHTNLHDLSSWSPFRRYEEAVTAAAEGRGLFVVPSFPAHRGRQEKTLWLHWFDSHPNSEGHAILAESLSLGLQGLPAHCGVSAGS